MALECPADTFVVTREGATISFEDSREDALHTYVDSRVEAQPTGARLLTLELHILVSPEVVKVCRYCVYCAGSPPPGIVNCAGLIIVYCTAGCFCSVHL